MYVIHFTFCIIVIIKYNPTTTLLLYYIFPPLHSKRIHLQKQIIYFVRATDSFPGKVMISMCPNTHFTHTIHPYHINIPHILHTYLY